jgi:hypothetical protein
MKKHFTICLNGIPAVVTTEQCIEGAEEAFYLGNLDAEVMASGLVRELGTVRPSNATERQKWRDSLADAIRAGEEIAGTEDWTVSLVSQNDPRNDWDQQHWGQQNDAPPTAPR